MNKKVAKRPPAAPTASPVPSQTTAAPVVTTVYDEGRSTIRFVEADPTYQRPLVVTFTGFEGARDGKPGFGEVLLGKLGYNCLVVKCCNRNNFYDISRRAMRRLAAPYVARHARVLTYGHSGGAYAALYFSRVLEADFVLAISPKNSRDPTYARRNRKYWHRVSLRHLPLRWCGGLDAVKLIVTDGFDDADLRFFNQAIAHQSRVHLANLPNSAHPATAYLAEIGMLKKVVTEILDGPMDEAVAAAMVARLKAAHREGRGRSSTYLCLGALRLARAGHVKLYRALVDRIGERRLTGFQQRWLAAAARAAARKEGVPTVDDDIEDAEEGS